MRSFSFLALLLAALLTATGLRAQADTPAPLPQLNIIWLGQGQVLEAAPPRQLSLHAHISEFAYQPGGLEIAYAGSDTESGASTQFVKLVGTRYGTTTTLIAQTSPTADPDNAVLPFLMNGWSADGRYLVVEHVEPVSMDSAGAAVYGTRLTRIDVGASPMRTREIALPVPLPADVSSTSTQAVWSPSHTRLLLTQTVLFKSSQKPAYVSALYDFAQNRVNVLPIDAPLYAVGWADDTHLRLAGTPNLQAHPLAFNVKTLKTEPFVPAPAPPFPDLSLSPTNPNVTLDLQAQTIADAPHTAQTHANVLWVRRTRGPTPLSALALDVTRGTDDPQARWAQTGRAVAYLSHGDLFVADLLTRNATIKEKYFAGEPLSCTEERTLAMSELKNIGLAAIQYAQDADENLPPQTHVNDTLQPYLPPDTLLQIGGAKFVYHAPADLALSAMDAPADTVLGTMDLPCARVTLYADGHVKALPVAGRQP